MKIIEGTKGLSKLCHAQPGDVIRIPQFPSLYLVACFAMKGCKPARAGATNGLYSDERPLFMVDLASGEARELPHLSSLVEIVRGAAVVEDAID